MGVVQKGHTNGGAATVYYEPPTDLDCHETRFRTRVEQKFGLKFDSYLDLHKWSCTEYDQFWAELAEYTQVKFSKPYSQIVDKSKRIDELPRWFEGSELNYTENCIERAGADEDVAFLQVEPSGLIREVSYGQLRKDVRLVATALRADGITVGDSVCGYMSNSYETAVAMLATAAIGAVWSSASCDFGPQGVLDRFSQIKPKVLFCVEAVTYKRKRFDMRDKLSQVVSGLPTLKSVVVVMKLGDATSFPFEGLPRRGLWKIYDDYVETASSAVSTFAYEHVSFSHPLCVLFSSGTTGTPKCIVHTQGGVLLKHVEEHVIQGDARGPADRMLFYTTCGWMMWNWMITFLFTGGSLVLFDESPLEPDAHVLPKLAAATKATIFGAGAKLYDEYAKRAESLDTLYDLSAIRLVLSTGSPLSVNSFRFINRHFSHQAVIGSIAGGTDILGCFMGGASTLPVREGECTAKYLGMDIRSFSELGKEVVDEQGELVCVTPFPSQPCHFANDPDGAKYRKAYFEKYPGVWAHGDFCRMSSTSGGVVMLGRSDTTLNRGGVRFGTADIYGVVEKLEEVADSIVAGRSVPHEEDEEIILFVRMKDNATLTAGLISTIRTKLRTQISPRHVPDHIFAVDDIPYTNSGKKVELAVKHVVNGKSVEKVNALRNPEALLLYRQFAITRDEQHA